MKIARFRPRPHAEDASRAARAMSQIPSADARALFLRMLERTAEHYATIRTAAQRTRRARRTSTRTEKPAC